MAAAAHLLTRLLSAIQLLAIAAGAVLFTRLPANFRGTVPWYGLAVKLAGAIAVAAVSFYLFRRTVRTLRIEEPDTRTDDGMVTALNLMSGACFTGAAFAAGALFLWMSHGDPDEAQVTSYWLPVGIGGGAVAFFAAACWLWWGSVGVAQACARGQRYVAAYVVAALPLCVCAGGWLIRH
jgi:hypothetical protein